MSLKRRDKSNAANSRKIAILSADLYGYFDQHQAKNFSGVTRIYRMVKWLAKNTDHIIMCFVQNFGQPDITSKGGIVFIKGPFDLKHRIFEILKIITRHNPDVIIEFYRSSRLFLLAILKKWYGKRYIYFVGSDADVDGQFKRLTNRFLYLLYVWGLKQADQIICQTKSQAEQLEKTYALDSKVILSPYVEITTPLVEKRSYIVWVGRSAYCKRPDLFLDLAYALPEHKCVMICNSNDRNRESIDQLISAAKKRNNLDFIEVVPHDQMRSIYARAKCLVNTSDFEGFPNTFIEAALEKTPIVSLNVDPNQMLSAFNAGVFCQGNFTTLVKVCRNLLSDNDYMELLGENARKYAIDHHNIDQSMKKILVIIDQVLKKKDC